MKRILTFLSSLLVAAVLSAQPALAAAGTATPTPTSRPTATPTPIECKNNYGYSYGNCSSQINVLINKTVQNPANQTYVENLTVNDPKYKPEAVIPFQISVKNPNSTVLSEVKVTDTIPAYMQFHSGPGTFNPKNNTLTFNVANLQPQETRTFLINMKAATQSALPADQAVTCIVNNVSAATDGANASDSSQACIEKNVLGVKNPAITKGGQKVYPKPVVKKTPSTGPEALALAFFIPSGIAGLILRKKTAIK